MSSLVKTLGVFSAERVIVERERTKGSYDVAPYFGAKLLAESPVGALFPLLFGAMLYPSTGLNPRLSRWHSLCSDSETVDHLPCTTKSSVLVLARACGQLAGAA